VRKLGWLGRDASQPLRNMERVHDLRILLRTFEKRNEQRGKKADPDDARVLEDAAYALLLRREIERIERQTLYAEMSQ
jgi:hypothetical protein